MGRATIRRSGPIAQLVELRTFNPQRANRVKGRRGHQGKTGPDLVGHLRRHGWSLTAARAAASTARAIGRAFISGRITQAEAVRRCRSVIAAGAARSVGGAR